MQAEAQQPREETAEQRANHLCVFVHGLWGNPSHLSYLVKALEQQYGEDELRILVCKRNASSFTYDGIEVGGERVAKEIEETLNDLRTEGCKIHKFSIVGYSLGGLIARYAIGLLYRQGLFENITPVNFTTFATPHLGSRTPLSGYTGRLWNYLGSRTLAASGAQLFTIDNFRETGRPLLSVLADPESIFIHALKQFKHRSLYTNIVNDRSAVYYTTSISSTDPYTQLDKLELHYEEGYEPVILDSTIPFDVIPEENLPAIHSRLATTGWSILQWTPRALALAFFIPLGVTMFLINSTIQTFRSRRRILLHESDNNGHLFQGYRVSWMVQDMRAGVEDAFEVANATQPPDYLSPDSEEESDCTSSSPSPVEHTTTPEKLTRRASVSIRGSKFPTLALTTAQFAMIDALDEVGFKKHPVHIRKSAHSHAAIIVRSRRAAFDEGKVVVKHWLEKEFEI